MNNTNPIESVTAWCDGVGHGPESVPLYTRLVCEEAGEMLRAIDTRDLEAFEDLTGCEAALSVLTEALKRAPECMEVRDRAELLDAALDTAWVSLCLARALTGDRLPEAWAELHRSNVTDKQRDGKFVKDASGKVVKPHDYRPADFAQFLLPAVESEGGEAD